MKTNIISLFIITTVILLLSFSFKEMKRDTETKQEMKKYFNENIFPVLKQQKEKLNALMEKKDIEQILVTKQEIKELQLKQNDLRYSIRKEKILENEVSDDLKMQAKENKKQLEKQRDILFSIAIKYRTEAKSVLEEIKEQKQQWRKGMAEIMAKNENQGKEPSVSFGNKTKKHNAHHNNKSFAFCDVVKLDEEHHDGLNAMRFDDEFFAPHPVMKQQHAGSHKDHRYIMFVLWDPQIKK